MHIINNSILQLRRKIHMNEEFVKEYKIEDKTQEELNTILVKNIIRANNDLQNASNNYQFAEGELIDYYLYQIKANQSKLNYLIKKSKINGITMDRINQIKIKNIDNYNVV